MANVVVIGTQWGDEGKGKIVDWLSERADVVVRFQGGHNAGHTLVIDGVPYKLNLLPSGVVRGGKLSIIGNGVVVDPWALADELEGMRAQGVAISPENLNIAENAPLPLPLHRARDRAQGRAAGAALDLFLEASGAQYDQAFRCLAKDRDVLLAFYDFPAEHWKHIRTTNPIESTFATVRLRTTKTKGCLSRMTALTMVFKLCQSASKKWRRLDGSHQLAEIMQGVKFKDGEKLTERAA